MDYEKKYKELVAKIKNAHLYAQTDSTKNVLDGILPELAESEDEMMMHQLHSWMKEFGGAEEYTEKVYTWLKSLLEKQGEKLPAGFYYVNSECEKFYSEKFKYGNVVLGIEKPCSIGIDNVPFVGSTNTILTDSKKKQGEQRVNYTTLVETGNGGINALVTRELPINGCDEQKPTDKIEQNNEMVEALRTEYEKGRADAIAEMQKEWSEDDEKRLQSCINILKAKSLMGKVDTANTMWLKSLKQRMGGKL